MKVQSPLQMNNYELQNAVVQNQGGFAEHDWRKGQLQFDSTENVDKLAVGIASGQGAEGSKYRYLLDSRANGVSNEMLSGFTGLPLDIESAQENRFPSCSAVKTFVNGVLSSAMIYKGTVTPSPLQKNAITVEAADYRYAGALDSGTYREKWANGSAILYTSSRFPSAGDSAYTTSSGGTAKTVSYVFSKLYADMFIEGGSARSTKPTAKGWVYKVTGSGYFGAIAVEAGDTVICNGGTGGSASDYDLVQANLDLQNLPQLRVVVSGGKNIVIGAYDGPTIGFFNAGSDGPTLSLVDSGNNKYLSLSCEGDDYDNLKTSGWIDAGALKENGNPLSSKYYLATNPSGFITSDGTSKNVAGGYCALANESSNWNFAIASNRIIPITSGENQATGAPSQYYSGLSVVTSYVGFQLCTYGGVTENLLFRKLQDNGTWHDWFSIFHSGNLTPSDYLKKAEGGTLNGPLTINHNPEAGEHSKLSLQYAGVTKAYLAISEDEALLISCPSGATIDGDLVPDPDVDINLGSSSSPWFAIYCGTLYENGSLLSDKYAPKSSTPKMFRANITGNAQGNQSKFDVTHNLGTQSPIVQIYEASSNEQVLVDVKAANASKVEITFGAAVPAGKVYNVVIMG